MRGGGKVDGVAEDVGRDVASQAFQSPGDTILLLNCKDVRMVVVMCAPLAYTRATACSGNRRRKPGAFILTHQRHRRRRRLGAPTSA